MRLEGKAAIITGGASGIGRAICELFAEEGARLTIADIDVEGGEQTLASVRVAGGEAQFIATDVSKEADVQAMVQAAADAYGAVNILVNDAAAFVFGEVQDISDADWARVFGVNVVGQAYCVKHVLPHMQAAGGGAIVNLASVSGFIAQPGFIPYNASKGAVMQLTRCLAMDLAPHNIRVNAVCPGSVLTPATERHRQFVGADPEEFLAEAGASNFMKRVAGPREIAYGALFLASDEASFVTGTPLVMDGGLTAQ
ncbi:MAG: SDR family oxidoreductase [Chloroflexota bacterium]|nr:SDR family oxidoreductase [Chloroflexota bacterium]